MNMLFNILLCVVFLVTFFDQSHQSEIQLTETTQCYTCDSKNSEKCLNLNYKLTNDDLTNCEPSNVKGCYEIVKKGTNGDVERIIRGCTDKSTLILCNLADEFTPCYFCSGDQCNGSRESYQSSVVVLILTTVVTCLFYRLR